MTGRAKSNRVRLKAGSSRKLLIFVGLVAAVFVALKASPYQLRLTSSESVGHSVFLVSDKNLDILERGQYVSVLAPDKPDTGIEYVKMVAGVEGDEVRVDGRDVYVAGVYRGRAKELSRGGLPLTVTGPSVIGEGQIYLYGGHKDSYDSRYEEIGLVSKALVTGKGKPLL